MNGYDHFTLSIVSMCLVMFISSRSCLNAAEASKGCRERVKENKVELKG